MCHSCSHGRALKDDLRQQKKWGDISCDLMLKWGSGYGKLCKRHCRRGKVGIQNPNKLLKPGTFYKIHMPWTMKTPFLKMGLYVWGFPKISMGIGGVESCVVWSWKSHLTSPHLRFPITEMRGSGCNVKLPSSHYASQCTLSGLLFY